MREREIYYGLVKRAAAAGFDTLMFTVDSPIAGHRMRDRCNGFSIPPQLTARTVLNTATRPWWWYDFFTGQSPSGALEPRDVTQLTRLVPISGPAAQTVQPGTF